MHTSAVMLNWYEKLNLSALSDVLEQLIQLQQTSLQPFWFGYCETEDILAAGRLHA